LEITTRYTQLLLAGDARQTEIRSAETL